MPIDRLILVLAAALICIVGIGRADAFESNALPAPPQRHTEDAAQVQPARAAGLRLGPGYR